MNKKWWVFYKYFKKKNESKELQNFIKCFIKYFRRMSVEVMNDEKENDMNLPR